MSAIQIRRFSNSSIANFNEEQTEYVVAGIGLPSIVLINGSGGPIVGWYKVFDQLSQLGSVIAYNRPGVGRSTKPSRPQTGEEAVRRLRDLLNHCGFNPPYILVGHSLGGLVANLFARRYSKEVSGVVLLDATAPEDVTELPKYESGIQRFLKRVTSTFAHKDNHGEAENVVETVKQIRDAGPFPEIPLIVVTGGKPAMAWATPKAALDVRARNQETLVKLSPLGRHTVARRSGHFPQFTEPGIVVDSVRRVIEDSKKIDRFLK